MLNINAKAMKVVREIIEDADAQLGVEGDQNGLRGNPSLTWN